MNNESQNTEYKLTWRDEYLKWVCGFANAQGGTIYIGIDDKGNIKGVDNIHRLSEDIPNKIATRLGIIADVNILAKDNLQYLEIKVQPSNIPISLNGAYHYRSGSTKQELKGIALQQFLLKKLGRSWDDIPHETATLNRISRTAIDYFLNHAIRASRMPSSALSDSTETILDNLNLITDDGKLRNAALLLFAENPQRYFPGSEFKIGRFGVSESDLMFQDVVEGNIIQMTEKVIELLRSKYLISHIQYEGLQRIEKLEIPEDALRELINNAICHKDYMGVAIQMKVYNDRVELWNDGLLPDGMEPSDLLKPHKSKPRNKLISAVFYRAGYIETWGRGIEKVCAAFESYGLKPPQFEYTCGGLNTIIYRNEKFKEEQEALLNVSVNSNNTENIQNLPENAGKSLPKSSSKSSSKILELLVNNPSMTTQQIAESLGISKRTVLKNLKKMKDKIIHVGPYNGGYWKINDNSQTQNVSVNSNNTENIQNLPENAGQSSPKSSSKDSPKSSSKSSSKILELLANSPNMTTQQIAENIGITKRAVLKNLEKMKDKIIHVGPYNGGYWKIIEP